MLKDLVGLVFPQKCPGCGNVLVRQEKEICLTCLTELPQGNFHRFPTDNPLYFRFAGKIPIEGALARYYFDKQGRMKRIVQALKYKNRPRIGTYLGEDWGESLKASGAVELPDLFVPVPLHKKRMRERGYNQAEKIAVGLGKALEVPVDSKSLIRSQKTQTQTSKGKEERWQNVKDVFELKASLEGHIGLVDDVVTTGATIEACIREIMSEGAENLRVSVYSLCVTRSG